MSHTTSHTFFHYSSPNIAPYLPHICESARICEANLVETGESKMDAEIRRTFFTDKYPINSPFCFTDYCPTIFDGWSCINATEAGTTATFSCPPFKGIAYDPECKCTMKLFLKEKP